MSEIPSDLKYTKSHEWVRIEDDGTATVGITDHAQGLLGDIVFVNLPEIESEITTGEEVAVIESVKTAADTYAPISGSVVAINETLLDESEEKSQPELINQDPYGAGWLFKLKPSNKTEIEDLLNFETYSAQVEDEA